MPGSSETGIDKDENFEDFITLNKIEDNLETIYESLLKVDAKPFEKKPIVIEQLCFRLDLNNGSRDFCNYNLHYKIVSENKFLKKKL